MSATLVERLREFSGPPVAHEAADRIEKLEAANAGLLAACTKADEMGVSFGCFLEMLANVLVQVHDEDEENPYVRTLRAKSREIYAVARRAEGGGQS